MPTIWVLGSAPVRKQNGWWRRRPHSNDGPRAAQLQRARRARWWPRTDGYRFAAASSRPAKPMSASPQPTTTPRAETVHGPNYLVWVFGYGSLDVEPRFRGRRLRDRDARRLSPGAASIPGITAGRRSGLGWSWGWPRAGDASGGRWACSRSVSARSWPISTSASCPITFTIACAYPSVSLPARRSTPGPMSPAPATRSSPATCRTTRCCATCCRVSGWRGPCAEYVRNTVAHLTDIGIAEPRLEALARRVDQALAEQALR